MSKTYRMPKSQETADSNNLVYLLQRSHEVTGMKLLKIAADEIERLHEIIREIKPEIDIDASVDEPIVIRMAVVLKSTSKYFNTTVASLTSQARNLELINARHVAMYVAKQHTDLSYPQIGAWFNRDHTTIVHAFQKIDKLVKTNTKIKEHVDAVVAMCVEYSRLEMIHIKELELCPTKKNLSLRAKPMKPQMLQYPKP